ncbi:hypothetical protein SAMN06298216_2773 [Spirosomataceae bacterium TFI 002]|nr:hypothetical protein SAMN06298216_2773 [Spirosomataceae bacterium TFI 002]
MKNRKDISDIELDELFKKASKTINPEFDESSWLDLEAKLDKGDIGTKGAFFNNRNLLTLLGIFLFAGIIGTKYFWGENSFFASKNEISSTVDEKRSTAIVKENLTNSENLEKSNTQDNIVALDARNLKTEQINKDSKPAATISNLDQGNSFKSTNTLINSTKEKVQAKSRIGNNNTNLALRKENNSRTTLNSNSGVSTKKGDLNSITKTFRINSPQLIDNKSFVNTDINKAYLQDPSQYNRENKIIARETKEKKDHKIYFSVGISPDFSKVIENSFIKMGHNWSAQLEYHLNNRWSIHSGLIVSEKFYGTKVDGMHWPDNWGAMPKEMMGMEGSCNVLDIPLNIRYNIKYDNKAKMYVMGGVSSFIMLDESYDYIYPSDFNMDGMKSNWESNKKGFLAAGMANFAIGYERKFGNIFSVQVEPFVKIPIRDFGFSQVKLASTGIFLTGKVRIK